MRNVLSVRNGLAGALILALAAGTAMPASALAAPAPAASWRPLAIGGGGFIVGIMLHPNGVDRIVRTDTYGAYVWRGTKWAQLVTSTSMPVEDRGSIGGGAVDAVFAPSNPKRIYLFFNDRMYRSDNKGVSFARLSGFGTAASNANDAYRDISYKVAVDPANQDVVYVGTRDDGLRVSRDGGTSWTKVAAIPVGLHIYDSDGNLTDPGGGISIFFDPSGGRAAGPARTRRIYTASWRNGVWVSNDAGGSWTRIADGSGSPAYASRAGVAGDGTVFAVDETTGKLWRWRAGAWTDLAAPVYGRAVAVDPTAPGRVYVFAGDGKAARSVDGGASWTVLDQPNALSSDGDVPWLSWTDNSFFTTSDVRFDPVVPGRLWVGQGFGVWKADVTDATTQLAWRSESRGIEQLVVNDVVAPPGGVPVVGAWDQGIFYKAALNQFAQTHGPTRRFNSAWQLDWTPAQRGFLVANVADHRFCCAWDGQAVQSGFSLDGGQSWTEFPSMPTPPGSDPGNAYRFAFGNIAVAADRADNIVWLPAGDGGPAVTTDRGATWSFPALPAPGANEAAGWRGGFYLNRKILAADRVRKGTFYMVNTGFNTVTYVPSPNAGVWRSTDGGAHWAQVYQGKLTDWSIFNAQLKTVPGRAGHLFFTPGRLSGDPVIPLVRSVDGGATWTSINTICCVHALGFGKPAVTGGYPTLFAAGTVGGQYGIWRSIDEGANWVGMGFPNKSLDAVQTVEGDKGVFGRVYVGFGGSGAAYGVMP